VREIAVAMDAEGRAETAHLLPATPVRRPRLQLAAGKRYSLRTREIAPPMVALEAEGFAAPPPDITLPKHKVRVMVAAASSAKKAAPAIQTPVKVSVPAEIPIPNPTGMLPLSPATKNSKSDASVSRPSIALPTIPQPLQTEVMRPMSKLEPLDEKPIADAMPGPVAGVPRMAMPDAAIHAAPKVHPWAHAVDFWKHAPRDLKTLVFAIPVLLGLALHPTLPKVSVSAPSASTGIQQSFQRAVKSQWVNVRQTMVDRAAVALDEDFRSGLDEWTSRGNATTAWSFDATGFVQPGPLALYRPSLGLTDYQMQFLGLIDKKALSWVVRAADFDNYYVVKLVVLKPGPLPTVGVTRYAVVNGRADARADTIAPVDAREDMLYRVKLDVHGDNYILSVQGQIVDSWSEPRLRHGGIGFFSARGEDSRLRWVQVTHQYDMLGRLCAYLAPYNISSTNGGWQQ
jgi:hypothetical protein